MEEEIYLDEEKELQTVYTVRNPTKQKKQT